MAKKNQTSSAPSIATVQDIAQVNAILNPLEEKIMDQNTSIEPAIETPAIETRTEKAVSSAEETPAIDILPTTIEDLWVRINARLCAIEEKLTPTLNPTRTVNSRGLQSTRGMTEADAIRIMTGDLKDESIKQAAITLGLSYGQIYSARNGYTFKTQYAARLATQKSTTPAA